MRWIALPTAAVAAALLASSGAAQEDTSHRITVLMTGEEEVAAGDPDGSGTATFRVNTYSRLICYTLRVSNIDPATAAHIHIAPPGVAGPVVVPLDPPTSGNSSGCERISRELALDLVASPEDYYVNVHNAPFPGGAIRGQLG
jgi:hypothetical protein